MNALILVDLQNDLLPAGAIAVPQGDRVIPLANQVQNKFKLVVATQDWHPPNHSSFVSNHPDKKVGEIVLLKKHPQLLWPPHCVQGTHGADFAPGLVRTRWNRIFKRGTDAELDSHSAFFDGQHQRATGLGDHLKEKKITTVFVLGLPTEYGVKFTALDSVMLGFKTLLIEDACRGINRQPGDVARAWEEIQTAGVTFVQSKDLNSGL